MAQAIYSQDLPGQADLRGRLRQMHLDYIRQQRDLVLYSGGVFDTEGNICGGIIVLNVATKEEVDDFIAEDPFTLGGLQQRVEIIRTYTACLAGEIVAGKPNLI